MTWPKKLQADGNPYPNGWSATSDAVTRLERFVDEELVLPWYQRRALKEAIRQALHPQEDR